MKLPDGQPRPAEREVRPSGQVPGSETDEAREKERERGRRGERRARGSVAGAKVGSE